MAFTQRMHSIPLSDIEVTDSFWGTRLDRLIEVTLPHEFKMIVETKRLENFHQAALAKSNGSTEGLKFEGRYFNDSDVYKWIEASAYAILARPNHPGIQQVKGQVDQAVSAIVAAQEADGYLNTYFQVLHPDKKWLNLNSMHEMYCGGHLIEAAVAHHEATGSKTLLNVAIKFADLVDATFGPGKRLGACGHQEIELALIELTHATHNPKYREMAKWMLEIRGQRPSFFEEEIRNPEIARLNLGMANLSLDANSAYSGDYLQDHAPIREHDRVVGHAVRAMYMYIAATQLAEEMDSGDTSGKTVETAVLACWNNLTQRRMYITGGIGPSGHNEGFTEDYDLPNLSAYAETCAAIGLAMWGRRLTEYTGNGAFYETVERALYNGVVSGISLTQDRFFYENPLESRANLERVPWFSCACCPPNIARLMAQIGRYAASITDDGLWLHLPIGFKASFPIGKEIVQIVTQSGYPWNGECSMVINVSKPTEFTLRFRIPEWCDDASFEIEGYEDEAGFEDGYAIITRTWSSGDEVKITFDMEPVWVQSHPKVVENSGRAALTRGPLVFALEDHELGASPQLFTADLEADVVDLFEPKLLGGVTTLEVAGWTETNVETDELYAPLEDVVVKEVTAKMIPYFAWNNRGRSFMQVWLKK